MGKTIARDQAIYEEGQFIDSSDDEEDE
jgi:hypothetical protein